MFIPNKFLQVHNLLFYEINYNFQKFIGQERTHLQFNVIIQLA